MVQNPFNMTGYTKLFGSIVDSTIWRESKETKIVWITMLAKANRDGLVEASLPGLADASRVSLDECIEALKCLSSPDKYSRTKLHEGRRIQEVDDGWIILNHSKYRAKMNADERREYFRLKKQEQRSPKNVHKSPTLSNNVTNVTQAEAEAEAYVHKERDKDNGGHFEVPTLSQVKAHFSMIGLPESEAESFIAHYESKGWVVGKTPMKSWTAAGTTWKKNYDERRFTSPQPKSAAAFRSHKGGNL